VDSDTKQRLLDAAEILLAQRGVTGLSLREVTRFAGASVSAAHYHFGSKDALLLAALLRRIEPVNRRRLALLAQGECRAAPAAPALEAVLEAFFRPVFETRTGGRSGVDRAHERRLLACLYDMPLERATTLHRQLFGEVVDRFTRALSRALPGVPAERVGLAMQCAIGAMVRLISGPLELHPADAPAGESRGLLLDDASTLRALVSFSAAGMRAVLRPGGDAEAEQV